MKTTKLFYLFLFLSTFANTIQSQNTIFNQNNFEDRFIVYVPIQQNDVSDDNFSYASMIIEETKKAVKNDPNGFNVSDYWNICTAFNILKESKAHLEIAFQKMITSEGSCEYMTQLKDKTKLDELFPKEYQQQLDLCAQAPPKKAIDLKAYAKQHQLDYQLLKQIEQVYQNDKKYRNGDYISFQKEQTKLDQQNQVIINQLYKTYKTYLGKSLVGEQFETAMWAIIQHSNLKMMEKYLPILQQAVQEKELPLAPFKMLIDRIYMLKYKQQIFGSQQGVPLADKAMIEQAKKKYKIE